MVWATTSKTISISKHTPHVNSTSGLIGSSLSSPAFSFSPLELYGAAARTSHLTTINPLIVTPESEIIRTLLEQHVDEAGTDFAILKSAGAFKDFVKSYFSGTVAAGLAYLAMVRSGYVWADHYENLVSPTKKSKSPDFVFTGDGTGTCLMEAKGTRRASVHGFEGRIDRGYVDQVEPFLGSTIGGARVTHGYCIGAQMNSPLKADLRVHHTALPANTGTSKPGFDDGRAPALVQRGNYARAFLLAHGPGLNRALRLGEGREEIEFLRFEWQGRRWLTRYLPARVGFSINEFEVEILTFDMVFAVEEQVADKVLHRFLGTGPLDDLAPGVARPDLGDVIAASHEGDRGGAAFPDGLALVRNLPDFDKVSAVKWVSGRGVVDR